MGTKLYQATDQGGIKFTTHREGHVRIPNYVFDLWLPLLGARAIGVYSVYCRLERQGVCKGLSQNTLAQACRVGTATLTKINGQLEQCGFIKIRTPQGHQKLMHWTTEIEVYDPPKTVTPEIIAALGHPAGYEVLSPWLLQDAEPVSPALPNSNAGVTKQQRDALPNSNAKVESLFENPEVEGVAPGENSPKSSTQEHLKRLRQRYKADPLTAMVDAVQRLDKNNDRSAGWRDASDDEFEVCRRVAQLWAGGRLAWAAHDIENDLAAAHQFLEMLGGDVRRVLKTIDDYHASDGKDLSIAGAYSLRRVLPLFVAGEPSSQRGNHSGAEVTTLSDGRRLITIR